ncbi:MAG: chloride channel protein [Firmicutes bacterium]|nr:chloride channel protein [Bacillota bacterium]
MEIQPNKTLESSENSRIAFLSGAAVFLGITAAVVAFCFYHLIYFFTNLFFFGRLSFVLADPSRSHLGLWVIFIPVIGALIIGVMIKYGSTKIIGHGIPEAMEAVLYAKSRIEPKVAILKPVSAALAIGTGGPFGAEGPIIQTGGAVGSLAGQFLTTTSSERKVLLACGAGAGMAATFNTPIAGVLIAIELLLFEFKPRSFIPLVISCAVAALVRLKLIGPHPLFQSYPFVFNLFAQWPFFVILGILSGLAAIAFTRSLYWFEDLFDKLKLDLILSPALGALGLGIIAYFVPRVLGVGYNTITDILNNHFILSFLFVIFIFKALAMLISLGSGTSGGLLAPMFMSTAAMGGAFAMILNHLFPSLHLDPGIFALTAMGAVFGSAARCPFAFIVFPMEVTGDFHTILPLMMVCIIAYMVTTYCMKDSIMTEKIARRGLKVPQEYEVNPLEYTKVSEVMDPAPITVSADMKLSEVMDQLNHGELGYSKHQAFPVLNSEKKLIGMITRWDLIKALKENSEGERKVEQVASKNLVSAYPDELVGDVLSRMLEKKIGRVPIIKREDPLILIGYLGRNEILKAINKKLEVDKDREPGLLSDTTLKIRKKFGIKGSPPSSSGA